MELILIFLAAAITSNFVLTLFLGICPFVGVSNKVDTALHMGMATTFVMTLTATIAWIINNHILIRFNLPFLEYVSFIITIAALVQFVEMFIKKASPVLFNTLGVFLPLITTNCSILGLALFAVLRDYNFRESIFFGIGAGAGFTLALLIMAGIREELELAEVPKLLQGAPITMLVAGILALCFMGFAGMIPA
jgi:electron transport complex protein RnfA